MTVLLVALGAAVGAPLRYLTDQALRNRAGAFPLGTLAVNVAGSLLLGTGFCGALTTYSTFSLDAKTLYDGGLRLRAAAYVLVSIVAGLAAAFVGRSAGSAL